MKTVAVKSDRPGGLLKASEGLFLLYVFLLPFSLFLGFPFGGARLQITDVVFVMSSLFWLVALASRSANFRVSPLYVFIWLYLGAMSVSAALSTDARLSLIKLLGVYYLAAVAVLTFNLCQRNGFARRALLCFLIGAAVTGIGTIVAVVGFYSGWESTRPMLSHYGSLPAGNYPRVRSVFENANMASNYLNVAAAAVVAVLVNGWTRFTVIVGAGLLAAAAAIFTVSPGIGGAVLTLGLLFWAFKKTERPLAARFALWSCIAFATVVLISTTLAPGLISGSRPLVEPVYSVRVQIWMNAVDRASEYPIFGRGVGMNTAEVFFTAPSGQKQILTEAHNAWLNILGQAGIVGLFTFVLLCVYCWSICRFHIDARNPDQVMLLAASCGFVGAFLYQNLFGSYEDARHLWVWIGFIAAAHWRAELNRENGNALG